MLTLGIDPGVSRPPGRKRTGWAVVRDGDTLSECGTIHGQYSTLAELIMMYKYVPVIGVQTPVALDGRKAPHYRAQTSAMSIAKNASLAAWTIGFGEGTGCYVIPCVSADMRGAGLKCSKQEWQLRWNWNGRTSQDARDAAQIAAWAYNRYQVITRAQSEV